MNDKKVARVCWNTNNWQKPSGKLGKVKNTHAYETETGYGHEEWFLDIGKLVDGYHYGYIQAIGQHRETYVDQIYDISFYTINSKTKERWWLGEILNVQVVAGEESEGVHQVYKSNGWLGEMHAQLAAVEADTVQFKRIAPENFFCIKFTPEDMKILEEPLPFSSGDPAVKSDYYNLKNRTISPVMKGVGEFIFASGGTSDKTHTTAVYRSQTKDIDLIHNQIQAFLRETFEKQYKKANVTIENSTGFGTKIDVVVKQDKSFVFYEIKTANTAKQSIREALSQLLEYSCYSDKNLAAKLVVVSPAKLTTDAKKYLENIRSLFKIPLFYQCIDLEGKKLSEEA
ncbi:hypothetical protein D3C85_839600 [compost metagenome]|jgi:hypothetical protein